MDGRLATKELAWTLWLVLLGIFVLGCWRADGSSLYIWALPTLYYGVVRSRICRLQTNYAWCIIGITILIPIALMLPATRRQLAKYYANTSLKMLETDQWSEAEKLRARAFKWHLVSAHDTFEKHKSAAERQQDALSEARLYYVIAALYEEARSAAEKGDDNKATALYKRIIELDPVHPEANYCLAMYYGTKALDRSLALRHLQIAHDSLPDGNVWKLRCKELLDQMQQSHQ